VPPLGFEPLGFCDLNGDGAVDGIDASRVYLNDGRGRFAQSTAVLPGNFDRHGFADVDGDGDSDVLVLNTGQPSCVWLNDGTGKLRDSGQALPSFVQGWGFVGAGDLTGDGFVDIVITNKDNPAQVWVNDGKGRFADSGVRLGDGAGNTWTNCVLRDFDNDGDIDVFITNRESGQHGLWFNQLAERGGRRERASVPSDLSPLARGGERSGTAATRADCGPSGGRSG
jgi:hypothetical protein